MHDAGRVRADVSALVVEILVVDGEDHAGFIHGRADFVQLLARMIGCDQMLTAVFDPFDRAIELFGGHADQNVFRIKFAADAEPAADVSLVDVDRARRDVEHARQQFLIAVRHLGGAVQLHDAARGVVVADGAARFERHAGMPADRNLDLDHVRRAAEYRVDVAVALVDDRRFARMARRILDRLGIRVEQRRQFVDLDLDQIGRILSEVGVFGKHRRDRIADITHDALGQHRLAIRIERRNAAFAKIDRRHVGNVGSGPHGVDARQRQRGACIDRNDAPMSVRRTNDAHVQLVREIDVACKLATTDHERWVLEPLYRLTDPGLFCWRYGHAVTSGARSPPPCGERKVWG